MKMTFDVSYDDGTTNRVTVSPMAVIGWERWSGRKMSSMSEGGFGMEDMCRMAYEQVKLTTNGATPEFDSWVLTVEDLDAVDTTDPQSGGGEV